MKTQKFYIDVTDTFAGEANFSWVRRYVVEATTERGAIWKLSRHEGYSWRKQWDAGDTSCYKAKGANVCCFVDYEPKGDFSRVAL